MRPLYNNYVREPWTIFIVLLLVVLLVTIVLASMIVAAIKDCFVPAEFNRVELRPVGYEFINDCIAISTPERGYLLLMDAIDNPEMLMETVGQGKCLYGSYSADDEKYARPMLWELQSENASIKVSIQDTLVAARKSAVRYCSIFASVLLAIWGAFGGITFVLYNAPRYSRLAKLLVRENFRNF